MSVQRPQHLVAALLGAALSAQEPASPDLSAAAALDLLARMRPGPVQLVKIEQLVSQLGDMRYVVRETAERQLLEFGPLARQLVAGALDAELLEVQIRARRILDLLDDDRHVRAMRAAFETLACERPAGALRALLHVAPGTLVGSLRESWTTAVAANLVEGDAASLSAMVASTNAGQRLLAVGAAALREEPEYLAIVRGALGDADAHVRLTAARRLADRGEREVLAVLVDLLADEDARVRSDAHAVLSDLTRRSSTFVAWDAAPRRTAAVDEWRAWLGEHGAEAELHFPLSGGHAWRDVAAFVVSSSGKGIARFDRKGRSEWEHPCDPYDVQALADGGCVVTLRSASIVQVIDAEGRLLRELRDLQGPTDADMLPNGHLLVLEGSANRVTEFDLRGVAVWRAQGLNNAFDAERLDNGNTLVADSGNNRLVEFDQNGVAVWEKQGLAFPNGVKRLADGSTLYTTYTTGSVVLLDGKGEQVFETKIGGTTYSPDVARDRIYVGESTGNLIVVLDMRGRILERIQLPQSFSDVSFAR